MYPQNEFYEGTGIVTRADIRDPLAPLRSHFGGEPVHGPLSAAEYVESQVTEHHGPTTLRAFTIRVMRKMTEGSVSSLIAIARRHGWRGFMGNPETDEYDTLVFINEVAS